MDSITMELDDLNQGFESKLTMVEEMEVNKCKGVSCGLMSENHGVCAICLDKIALEETALVKGCEHAYCVTCILRWATYNNNPSCPQCKHPFEFLILHRSLDGCIHDHMFEESVCLLLRASWFIPLMVEVHEAEMPENYEYREDNYPYEEDYDDMVFIDHDDVYYPNSSVTLHIGNRRWGENGFIRGGRKEARPVNQEDSIDPAAGSSRGPKKKEAAEILTGRRAKRALKREAADKAAAAAAASKHEQLLIRLGRK